ncbi:MerR family DNA-binding transcriptional regulator [Paenibacillus sp. NPDC093718]|uniref:MerR family DNA-binding transcriptional regulator n=1 Tax=Paenibacillus sp. NPDC093718 TaxID=3390601 RepID=UPI003D0875FF
MYRISEFSQITGLSKETLRYYAEVKLLEPAYIEPSNNYRYYDVGSYFFAKKVKDKSTIYFNRLRRSTNSLHRVRSRSDDSMERRYHDCSSYR